MRKIKFRAWNGKEILKYDSWFTLHGQSVLCFEEGKDHSYVDESDIDYPNRVELMQYTGLKDKNGVEIYEGDILRLKNSKGQTANHQEVYWNKEAASFDWRTANDDSWPDGFTGFYDEYEIIGNIYENPELVK